MPSCSVSSPRSWLRPERTRLLSRGLLAALLCVLVACAPEESVPLRLATSPWLGTEPLFLARDLGLLPPEQVKLVELTDVPQVVSALLDGAVDAAAVTLPEALRIIERHAGFKVVLVADSCDGADVLIAQSEIADLASLAGKRIGLDDSALSAHVLNRALETAGLALRDIRIVTLSPDEQAEAFAARRIDALVSYDPTLARVHELGGHVLFDTTQIPVEISDVILVRTDRDPVWLARRARELLAGWFGAVDYLAQQPAEAAARIAPRVGFDPALVTAALAKTHFPDRAQNARHLAADPPGYVAIAERVKSTLIDTQAVAPALDPSTLFDPVLAGKIYR